MEIKKRGRIVNFRVSEEEMTEIEAAADASSRSVSDFARTAIILALNAPEEMNLREEVRRLNEKNDALAHDVQLILATLLANNRVNQHTPIAHEDLAMAAH